MQASRNRVASTSPPGPNITKCFCAPGSASLKREAFCLAGKKGKRGRRYPGSGTTFIANNYAGLPSTSDRKHQRIKRPVGLTGRQPQCRAAPFRWAGRQCQSVIFRLKYFCTTALSPQRSRDGKICLTGILNYARVSLYWVLGKGGGCELVAYYWKLKFILYLLNVDCDNVVSEVAIAKFIMDLSHYEV